MDALALIWMAALTLCAGALGWMLILIALRMRYQRVADRRTQCRREVEAAFVALMLGRCDVERELGPYRRQAQLLAETLLEFMSIVRGDDREVVLAAFRALGIDAAFRRRLTRGSLAGRLTCTEALAAFPDPETERALAHAARSGDSRLRLAALRSIVEMGGRLSIASLVNDLAAGRLELSRLAAELVRGVAAADPAATLALLAEELAPPPVCSLLLDGLGSAGDYAALPCLMAHAAHPDDRVRAAAAHACGRLMHPAAETCLAGALTDESWNVRSAAAEAIGDSGFARLAPELVARLADPVWRVRFDAATALVALGEAGRAQLRAALGDGDETVRSAAALALAETRAA